MCTHSCLRIFRPYLIMCLKSRIVLCLDICDRFSDDLTEVWLLVHHKRLSLKERVVFIFRVVALKERRSIRVEFGVDNFTELMTCFQAKTGSKTYEFTTFVLLHGNFLPSDRLLLQHHYLGLRSYSSHFKLRSFVVVVAALLIFMK